MFVLVSKIIPTEVLYFYSDLVLLFNYIKSLGNIKNYIVKMEDLNVCISKIFLFYLQIFIYVRLKSQKVSFRHTKRNYSSYCNLYLLSGLSSFSVEYVWSVTVVSVFRR